ncbi:MAG: electron transfer flavoprotein subunit alpha/FixB family protein, partial [Actinomycetota bacterium]
MLAVVFARDGAVPAGGDEVVAECGGRVLVCGTGAREAADALQVQGARAVETGQFEPGTLAQQIAPLLDDDIV